MFSSQPKSTISAPTNVTHVTHVGWTPQQGFELRNIPDEWKQIFKAAGVRRSDLTDPETARVIVTLIAENMIEGRLASMPLIPGIGQAVAGLAASSSHGTDGRRLHRGHAAHRWRAIRRGHTAHREHASHYERAAGPGCTARRRRAARRRRR
jgi:hypothetical protein